MKALGLTVAAFVLGLAAAANAATVSQTFTFTGNGTSTANSFVMTEGDLTLSAALFETPGGIGSTLVKTGDLKLTRSNSYGLYVAAPNDNDHRIDGYYNEIVSFDFGTAAVRITNVTFGSILNGSVFDLYVDDLYEGSQTVESDLDLSTDEGSVFAIGASAHKTKQVCYYTYTYHYGKKKKQQHKHCSDTLDTYSGFKILSLTVEYDEPVTTVPLPAGGALAVLRRRKPL